MNLLFQKVLRRDLLYYKFLLHHQHALRPLSLGMIYKMSDLSTKERNYSLRESVFYLKLFKLKKKKSASMRIST